MPLVKTKCGLSPLHQYNFIFLSKIPNIINMQKRTYKIFLPRKYDTFYNISSRFIIKHDYTKPQGTISKEVMTIMTA